MVRAWAGEVDCRARGALRVMGERLGVAPSRGDALLGVALGCPGRARAVCVARLRTL